MSTHPPVPAELESEPDATAALFGDRRDLAREFTNNLARFGEEYGLIGPLELPRLWTRHILNSAIVAPLLKPDGTVADIGSRRRLAWSGAGDCPTGCFLRFD